MTPAIRSMLNSVNIMISGFEKINKASGNCINAAEISAARAELANAETSFIEIENAIEKATNSQDRFNQSISAGTNSANMLKSVVAKIGTAIGIKKLVGISDEFVSATARLNLMNDGLQTTQELQNRIFASAQRSRAVYSDTVSTISRLGILAGKAFTSNNEVIAFAELMNKNFIVGGASATEQASAMYQLTQAMASGRLQGDEYRSIIENAPLLAKSIEDYMINVQKAEGTMKDWASEGLLTANVIKAALFNSADEIEERFANMPMTWSQVWTIAMNRAIMASQPLLEGINYLAQNWGTLEPIIVGVAGAIGIYSLAMGVQTAATWAAVDAAKVFFLTMLQNPLFWVAMGIGVVIAVIYKWIQSVGGAKIAWMVFTNHLMNGYDAMLLGAIKFKNGFLQELGNLKIFGLNILDSFINESISAVNELIRFVNKVPGVSVPVIGYASEMAHQAAMKLDANIKERDDRLKISEMENRIAKAYRQREIDNAKISASTNEAYSLDYSAFEPVLESIKDNTGRTADSLEISEEDVKYLRDIAEREVINRFTTAEIKVDFKNEATINSSLDIDGVMNTFTEKLREAIYTEAEEVHMVV